MRTKRFGLFLLPALALMAGLSATPGFAAVGARCGGIIPLACGPHEFCQKPTGTCAAPWLEGTCVRVPHVCAMQIVAPVCGCNGKTYSNDCLRQKAMVSEAHPGKCVF